MSHPDKLRIAEYKPLQLQVALQLGFQIPDTLITNSVIEAQDFLESLVTVGTTVQVTSGRASSLVCLDIL